MTLPPSLSLSTSTTFCQDYFIFIQNKTEFCITNINFIKIDLKLSEISHLKKKFSEVTPTIFEVEKKYMLPQYLTNLTLLFFQISRKSLILITTLKFLVSFSFQSEIYKMKNLYFIIKNFSVYLSFILFSSFGLTE